MKQIIFNNNNNNNNYAHNFEAAPQNTTHATVKDNLAQIHSHIVHQHKQNYPINTKAPGIHNTEHSHTTNTSTKQIPTPKLLSI